MKKYQLDRIFDRGLVVHFSNKEEQYNFMKEIKEMGGRWINGEEIVLPQKPCQLPQMHNLHVDRNYMLGKVSAMCYHFAVFPTILYTNFQYED